MTNDITTYSNELLLALRVRDVPGPRIAEALAEVHSHVAETGEDPREAFGPPTAYADGLTAALGQPTVRWSGWRSVVTWSAAAYGVGGAGGAWLLLAGLLAVEERRSGPLGLPAALALLLGLAVLVALTLGFGRLARREASQVLDPRTGADMTPPLPRWVLPVMVVPPLLSLVLAAVLTMLPR